MDYRWKTMEGRVTINVDAEAKVFSVVHRNGKEHHLRKHNRPIKNGLSIFDLMGRVKQRTAYKTKVLCEGGAK